MRPIPPEIMINNYSSIWLERRGRMKRLNIELAPLMLGGAIRSLASSVEKSAGAGTDQGIINAAHQNLRIAAVMRPTAMDRHARSIRKHREAELSLEDYVSMGAFSAANARPETADEIMFRDCIENEALMRALVQSRKNVLVAGGTLAGKTTFLNAMISKIPNNQRIITIKDQA